MRKGIFVYMIYNKIRMRKSLKNVILMFSRFKELIGMNEKSKYQIIMQGITSNNVSKTCKEFGISRTIYYQWYNAYNKHGMEGLLEKNKKPVMPNKVDLRTEKIILEYVAKFPEDGPKRIYYELLDEGVKVGESGIYNVLRRNSLNKKEQRESYAKELKEKKRLNRGTYDNQVGKGRPKTLDYKMKNSINAHPGYICQQSIHDMGVFPKFGKVYQYVIYDVFSRVGIVKLYHRKSTINILDFMQIKVLPLMRTFHFVIDNLVTNQSREFTTNWDRGNHKYTEFLHKNNINQIAYTVDNKDIFQPLDSFVSLLSKEFYQQAWIDDSFDSFDILEKRLHEFVNNYNFRRKITDGPNQGRLPADVVLDYTGQQDTLPLWFFTRR